MDKASHLLSRLSPEKRALLEKRLLARAAEISERNSTSDQSHGPKPLTAAQESLWFLQQLNPGSPLYNIYEALRLTGPLNVFALEKALQAIVQRHDALRTRIICAEGKPAQVVNDTAAFQLEQIDLSSSPEAQRAAAAREKIDAEAKQGFDFSRDSMMRAKILKITEREHILILTVHHIVSDLASFVILHDELSTFYRASCDGTAPAIAPLKIQFPDFAAAENARLQKIEPDRMTFWRNQFAGELSEIELPSDRARPVKNSFKGKRKELRFSAAIRDQLKELGCAEGVTLYVTLLAAFQALLHRYSGQENIIVGTPISTRNSVEAEKSIGYFINTLPMRTSFGAEWTFRELLKSVRRTALDAVARQEIPCEKIIEELRLPRNSGRNPLFQTVFQFLPAPFPSLDLPGVECERLQMDSGTAKFDLTLTLAESSAGLEGSLEFNTDLFDESTIDRLISHFETLLLSAIANPEEKIRRLKILPSEERELVLEKWNATSTDYPRSACIHELFEAQVEQTPNAIALRFEHREMTYAELDRRANKVANYLRKFGVGPDVLVGFCVERSLEMMVGLLGILKAGGAYVTLDASYPRERLKFMFEDIGAPVFLTVQKFKKLVGNSAKVICLDENAVEIENESDAAPKSKTTAENLAYAIYTSGSTGKPKGVLVPHRGVVRLVKSANYLPFSADDVFLQFAPISFDASTLEIWGPLLNGGKLVIFPPQFESLEQLARAIHENEISTVWLTAGLFHQMIEHHGASLKKLKFLLAGGDVLSVPHVMKALRELPQTQLINGYGPTENTTFTCCFSIPRDWAGERSVPIGKPISNTRVYILDEEMQPVPIGVPGELLIGGDGLAREYLNAPGLTAEKFVPFSKNSSEKLYRTGDLVRWLPEGNIEFLGRLDCQVKIRGFRVELGEIESALAENPLVQQCAIGVHSDKSGTKQIVAYVVPRENLTPNVADLRAFLETRLPAYMLPARFVFLQKLPLNSSGKVDRRQLPVPTEISAPNPTFTAPRNSTEAALVEIWREVLGREKIGVEENFFELGGHSLLATRIVSRIGKSLNVELPLSAIFEAPTVASLARAVEKRRSKPSENGGPILRRVRRAVSPSTEKPERPLSMF